MSKDKVVSLRQPDEIDDPLTEILRSGAKWLIEQAVEAEFAAFLCSHADLNIHPPHSAKSLQSKVIFPDRLEMRPACPALS